MSLILDALSRAERDKRAGESATPDILSQPPPVKEPVRSRWPVILLVVFATVLSVVGAYWLYRSPAPSVPPAQIVTIPKSGDVAARSPLSGVAQSSLTFGAQPKPSRPPAPVSAREVAALYAESALQTPQRETDDGEVGSLSSPAQPASGSDTPAASIDVERVLRKVRREYPVDEVEEHPVPLLESLPQQFRDSVPTLMYSHHDYNAGGRSSVLLNGQTLVTGQTTRGVQVLEILADSVVLRFAGTDFRLHSLNSWVNL